MKKIAGAFIIATLGGVSALGLNYLIKSDSTQENSQLAYQAPVKYINMPSGTPESIVDFTVAAEMSVHSVVNVKTTYVSQNNQNQYFYDPFRGFFGQRPPQQYADPPRS